MVAAITSLVQSEVVQAEPILLAELSQLETKTEVSFFEEKRLIKHFRKAKFFPQVGTKKQKRRLKTFQVFGQKQALRDGGEVFAQEGRFTALPRLITFPKQQKRSH